MRQLFLIIVGTVQEAIHRRAFLVILFVGLLFMIAIPSMSVMSPRQETMVLTSAMLGIIQITGISLAITIGSNTLPTEIDNRTVYLMLSKPLSRYHFYIGKALGIICTIISVITLMSCVLFILPFLWQKPYWYNQLPSMIEGVLMYMAQCSLLSAVTFFFSTFLTPMVAFFLGGGTLILSSIINAFINGTVFNKLSWYAQFGLKTLEYILPNYSSYNVQNSVVHPEQQLYNQATYWASVFGYSVTYLAILFLVGVLIFNKREL